MSAIISDILGDDYGNDYTIPGLRLICETVVNDALKPLCAMLGPPQTPPGPPTNNTAPPVKARSAEITEGEDYSYRFLYLFE